jgi:hypothetical protein
MIGGYFEIPDRKKDLTREPVRVTGFNNSVIFLTDPAKKKVIEQLKTLETIKRGLLEILKQSA